VGNLFVSNQGCSTGQRAVGGIGIALMILGTAGMITSAVLLRRRKQERKRLHASRRLHWNHASGSFVF
jgi:Trk-type K+ transport system membrane component